MKGALVHGREEQQPVRTEKAANRGEERGEGVARRA